MALWEVTADLRVTYVGADGERKECGKGEPGVLDREVLDWVIRSAAPGDVIQTPAGTFVRQEAAGSQ